MKVVVLGGGIAALSLGAFLKKPVTILEKEREIGGLCRSFSFDGIKYDVGPHIIFSKYKRVLDFHNSLVKVSEHKRLNRILLNGSFIRYPIENFLGEAVSTDRDWALHDFINNPYEKFTASNMQQFFLNMFGEGMTSLYFQPYNKKIWKLDPSFLDLQMVERIPKPPRERVISGSHGEYHEGYTHQLTFTYPNENGFQSIPDSYKEIVKRIGTKIVTDCQIHEIEKQEKSWLIRTSKGEFRGEQIVSTIPLPQLVELLTSVPEEIALRAKQMMSNDIHIIMLRIRKDRLIDQFALYVPDPRVIFHRLSRLNFLGESYGEGRDELFLMAEVTFRKDSFLGSSSHHEIIEKTIGGLETLGIAKRQEVINAEIRTFENAYVIYDLEHRKRTDQILSWVKSQGIVCTGRFGKFEYQNSDQVVNDSMDLAESLNSSWF